MSRFRFPAPGAERTRVFKTASGVVVPRGMLSIEKASRAERALPSFPTTCSTSGIVAMAMSSLASTSRASPTEACGMVVGM